MRILYLATHKLWPLNSGNRLRDFHLARELAKRASVTFVEICQANEQPSCLPTESPFEQIVSLRKSASYSGWKTIRGLMGPTPLPILNYVKPDSARRLESVLAQKRFDSVQVEGVHLTSYLSSIQRAPGPPPVVIDWQNIESELMRRYSENTASLPRKLAARRTAHLLARSELMLLKQGNAHTVVSERERNELLSRHPRANVCVVPNGVDVSFFARPPTSANAGNQRPASSGSTVVFVGSMDYHANIDGAVWFAREVWPAIAAQHPSLEFVIVGRSPSKEVRALASDRIRVTGTVEDVRPYYACAIASVVPLRVGGGTRLKILEAMAAGVPVVSTTLGAEGLDAVPNTHYLLANRPTDVVDAITQLHDLSTRDRIVQAARAFAVSHYDWSILGSKLYQVHSELVQRQGT